MKRRLIAFSIVAGALVLLPRSVEASGESRVRVLHASPDAPAVDVLVNGNVAIEDLSFGNVTEYIALPEGSYSVKVRPANSAGPDVISTQLNLQNGRDYTVAAVNKLASIKANIYEDKNLLQNDNRAKVRVIHLSPGAPAVDVALKSGKVLIGGLTYENASKYLRLKPGKYDLEVRIAGTQSVVLDVPGFEVTAGNVYQVYAVGVVGSNPEFGVRLSKNEATSMVDKHKHKFEAFQSRWESRKDKFINIHY